MNGVIAVLSSRVIFCRFARSMRATSAEMETGLIFDPITDTWQLDAGPFPATGLRRDGDKSRELPNRAFYDKHGRMERYLTGFDPGSKGRFLDIRA
jgi:hypothetical protein